MTSLVHDSLNFILSGAKATHIFSQKNIRILYIESAKTVNEMTLNKLVKLMKLWTTGPWFKIAQTSKSDANANADANGIHTKINMPPSP